MNNLTNQSQNTTPTKSDSITFIINYKDYTIDLSKMDNDSDKLKEMFKKYLPTGVNTTTDNLLLAYINQSKDLVELENKIAQLYAKIKDE